MSCTANSWCQITPLGNGVGVPWKGNAVFRTGNKCWVFLHVGVTWAHDRGAGTVCCMYMDHCILLFLSISPKFFCSSVLLFFCSSYRQLRVAVQCRTYKGHFRSSLRFLSASQPTEPPGPQLPPRKTPRVSICIACVLAMRTEVGQDTDAASR